MKFRKVVLIALGIAVLAVLPMQSLSAYPGPWGPCARLSDPIYADPFFNPLGPSPGQVRACHRRMWKYGPPPWLAMPPPPVTPVIVIQSGTEE